MRRSTSGGSLPRSLRTGRRPKAIESTMASGFSNGQNANGDAPRASGSGNGNEGELTQLLRLAMADATSCLPEALAVALPTWKRMLDFAIIAITLPVWLPLMVF